MTGGALKSTLHRVVRNPNKCAKDSRFCLAFFLVLQAMQSFALVKNNRLAMTFEEWRKQRIQRSMSVLKGNGKRKSQTPKLTSKASGSIEAGEIYVSDIEIYRHKYRHLKHNIFNALKDLFRSSMGTGIDEEYKQCRPAIQKFIRGQLKRDFTALGEFTHKYSVLNGGVILLAHNNHGKVFGMAVLAAVTEPGSHRRR